MSDRYRYALVWNYEDDNYGFRDVAAVVGDGGDPEAFSLAPAVCLQYGFEPGWATRWEDALSDGIAPELWQEAGGNGRRWIDYYEQGSEEDVFMLTELNGVWRDDQVVDNTSDAKDYFVERIHIDLDDIVKEWTSNKLKHLRQFYFHMLTPDLASDPAAADNSFDFYVGWSLNLMQDPVYQAAIGVPLTNGGDYKVDFRATGRYLAITMIFNATQRFVMTGGDLDAEESYGR